MRKNLTMLLASAAIALTASAQTLTPIPIEYDYIRNYTTTTALNKPFVCTSNENDTYERIRVTLLDENLNSIKVFNAPEGYSIAAIYDIREYDASSLYLTQYLFNSDDKYEIIYYNTSTKEAYVADEDGNVLLILPSDIMGYSSFDVYVIGSKKYIGNNSKLYRIDAESEGVPALTKVADLPVAYPNPVAHGEAFKISNLKDAAGATVTVNALNGELVKAFSCDADTREASIDTTGMVAGVYIYTVTRNGRAITSGKLIIE